MDTQPLLGGGQGLLATPSLRNALIWLWLVVLLSPMGTAAQPPPQQSSPLVLTHITVIDATGAPAQPDMTVVITGDRITTLGPSATMPIPPTASLIDARGKFVIPGLWDMHVHTLRKDAVDALLPLFIANGVTSVRDMGSTLQDFDRLAALRQQLAQHVRIGPRIVAAPGPVLDGPQPVWPGVALPVANPADARRAVHLLQKHHVEFLKPYNNLSRAAYVAMLAEAKKLRLPVAGHVPLSVRVEEASDHGQQIIEHLGSGYAGLLLACSTQEAAIRERMLTALQKLGPDDSDAPAQFAVQRAELSTILNTYSDEKAVNLFARLRHNGTWLVPTLSVSKAVAYAEDLAHVTDERLQYLPKQLIFSWGPQQNPLVLGRRAAEIAIGKQWFRKQVEVVGALYRAGVLLLAGTDTPAPYVFPGFSLHEELALLVEAGLTPMAALQTATRNPAQALQQLNTVGTIEPNKVADLLVLNANPLEDIHNIQRIAAVVVRGRYLSQAYLYEMLAERANGYAQEPQVR